MHPESEFSHFSKWRAKRHQDCINACGLAYRQYRNKPARIGVLTKLLEQELPLDTEEVKRELTRRNIPITTHHPTKLALQLLDSMTGTVREPIATNDTGRRIKDLCAVKLVERARKLVEKFMYRPRRFRRGVANMEGEIQGPVMPLG